jgi:DNA helicase II / ATP-dependent DNA helicase PcrA
MSVANPDHPLLHGLNEAQQRAVTTIDGPVLVVAGPGSGKTRVLVHRIAWLLSECGVLPSEILAVTFTNKAAREMRDRIERLLDGRDLTGLVMGTFHSFGARLLRQNPGLVADRLGLLSNFLIYDDADQLEVVKKSIIAIGLDPKQLPPRRMLARISAAKSMLMSPQEYAAQVETYDDEVTSRVFAQYQKTIRKNNAVDFDDLLGLPLDLFDKAPGLLESYQRRFRHVMVDEYQDTNRVQYILVSALAEANRNLFVVGDPDQSIYGWRQADIRNILDFEKDFPDATRIDLELNYRSTMRIVDTADRVIRANTQRIDRRLRTENQEGERIILKELPDGTVEARWIVDEIRRLEARGRSGNDIAVMFRTGAQSRVLEEAFRISDIPYRIVGGLRFYERKEVKDVLAVLRLVHNPADEVSLERVIGNMPVGRGLGPKALEAVRDWAGAHGTTTLDGFVALAPGRAQADAPALSGAARTAAARLGGVFAELREATTSISLAELFDRIVSDTGYETSFDHESEDEMQRWGNVLELRRDLERYEVLEPSEQLPTYLEQVALVSDVDGMEDDARGQVTLITLHSAKGLEFPVVFIAGLEEGLLPINRAVEAEWSDPTSMEEERRLFYVGVTRAEELLYLTYAGSRQLYGRYQPAVASRFLAQVPAMHLQEESRRTPVMRGTGGSPGLANRVRNDGSGDAPGWTQLHGKAEAAAPAAAYHFSAGEKVFHAKFGEGAILEANDRRDGDQELVIAFQRHGEKRLMASFANLEPIGDE